MKWLFLSVMVLASGACASIDKAKRIADSIATVVIADTCAMSLGSYFRLENPNHKAGSTLLCDPNAQAPITREDVLRLLED